MTDSKTSNNKNSNKSDHPINQVANPNLTPVNLFNDADYLRLNEHYQNADFAKSKEIIEKLMIRYPEHLELIRFNNDLKLKMSLKAIEVSINKEEKQKKKRMTFKLATFAFFGTLVVLIAFFISYLILNKDATSQQMEEKVTLVSTLIHQTEQLLLIGQPQPAAEIIEKIRTIDPDYQYLVDLSSRTEELLLLEADYQKALNLIAEDNHNDALVILHRIEAEKPGLWDVSQKIEAIETINQIAILVEEGNTAFQINNWDEAISAYESTLKLDHKLDHPPVTEQLIKSYFNKTISILQNENTTIEEVEIAEQYYRKAIVLKSQNKALASAMENLQEESSNLLFMKFTQSAEAILEDTNQDTKSIAKAVSFLKKALIINPTDTELQVDLQNAANYQIGFNSFNNMEWNAAINNFSQIASEGSSFTNSNVDILSYEAHTALGVQYYSEGLYQDALKSFKQAETFTQSDSGNLMKLFQVQVLLGDTLGKMDDYGTAIFYYQAALNAIQAGTRLTNHPAIAAKYDEAINMAVTEDDQNAFAAFQEVLRDISVVYSIVEIEANEGVNLALFAHQNASTLDAIFGANNLSNSIIITKSQNILVPMIEK